MRCSSAEHGLTDQHRSLFNQCLWVSSLQPPNVVCSICKRDGHLKDDCPDDFKKIELKPLPPMNDRFREILDGLCKLCFCTSSRCTCEHRKEKHFLKNAYKKIGI